MERFREPEASESGSLMKRIRKSLGILLMVAMAGCSNCSDETLHRVCPSKCYTGEGQAGVGQCNKGTPICDEDMNVIECEGQGSPSEEVCNGIDSDCNGKIDDNVRFETRCKVYGECRGAIQRCLNGVEVCDYPGKTEFPDEVSCDNLDNNCNSRIDDIDYNELCFDSEFWRSANGICRAGVKTCLEGEIVCSGQILPQEEICDGIDNSCSGIIDDTEDISAQYDIALSMDNSGSMCGEIEAVLGALDSYVEQYENNPNYRFAVILMSANTLPRVQVLENFTNITAVRDRLQVLNCDGSGAEASLDVLLKLCEHNNGDLGLNWRDSANAIIFSFTDESPQSYIQPPVIPQEIIDTCLANGVIPFQWSRHRPQFEFVEDANGLHFETVSDFQQLLDNLNSINIVTCRR